MKKKQLKKLQLNKKTLRNLDDRQLENVAGGATVGTCATLGTRLCSECTQACSICCP